ncbi:MAG TPA: hypothetical protein VFI82_04320 [Terriglobales bacterium]|nr:hypothetical protein [Terriglobales bacterium]
MKPTTRHVQIRRAIVGLLAVFIVAAIGLVARTSGSRSLKAQADAIVGKKGDVGEIKPGRNAEAGFGASEKRGPDFSPDIQAYLIRAYPAAEIPMAATLAAQSGWASLNAGTHSAGTWQLIGPSKATQPGVLDVLADGAQYVTAGRVTAMAIGPACHSGGCPIYVAAAGGGIWRTRDGLAGSPRWEFVSGSFATNAIGSLVVDPNDATGNTLYAGTGEPNISADSEAGMGIYKSTDGGNTWTLLPGSIAAASNFRGRAVASLAITPSGDILAGIARAVRGVSSTDGATTSNPPAATNPATFGVYKSSDGGATFTNVSTALGSVRGVNQVAVDPNNGSIYYASFLGEGVWRSSNSGATWTQIKNPLNPPNNANNTDRSEFALANNNGTTRMYVGIGASGGPASRFYRADNAQTATNASFVDKTTTQNIGYCDPQCWYDNFAYSPPGFPDVVYLLGSFSYGQLGGVSNGRAVLLSTDGGATWSDLTLDGDPNHADGTHPDQHAIVVNPNNPFQYWEGSDGGVVRSDGNFANVSYKCNTRGLSPSGLSLCQSLLWRVPNQLYSMNEAFSTLQFQSLSASAKRPQNNAQGGTQDNGTWQYSGSPVVWYQEMYGDGGQSGFSAADDSLRFNTFTGQANDANFRNGDPTRWVFISAPIFLSPESSYFYPPIIADPNPAQGGTIFQGSFSVWRTQDWGGSRSFLEANCPELGNIPNFPACGDFVRVGPTGATDLTAAALGTRAGGAVATITRMPSNTGTLWVATGTGRVFISDNADAAANSVTFTRLDSTAANSPGRFVTGIAVDPTTVDPTKPRHAWVSYSGYNVNTPAQPGHVFEVTLSGSTATWTDVSYNLPDLPITALVRDDVTGDLYAASDFGVMRLAHGTTTWTVAGSGLPMVEVPGLTIIPSARLLYAATHGRSAWVLQLP